MIIANAEMSTICHIFFDDSFGSADIEVKGNILDYEYTIGEGNQKIAEVSKKWFHVADTYGVETAPGQNDVLILAIAVAIDAMVHPQK